MAEVRVLVVDDEPRVAAGHAEFVARVPGFTPVATVGTLHEALRVLPREPVDLVLLDLNLPDGHGLELVRSLRAAGRTVDILAITAVREVPVVRAALALGVVGYLMKPFTFADFADRLAAYARYRKALTSPGSASQQQVDLLLRDLHQPPSATLAAPKGLSREVLDQVIEALREAEGGRSASEVGDRLGTSRVTARRYLQYLADTGMAERSQRTAGHGRPEITFRWRAR